MRTVSAVPATLNCVQIYVSLNYGHLSIHDSQLGPNGVHYGEVTLYTYVHTYVHILCLHTVRPSCTVTQLSPSELLLTLTLIFPCRLPTAERTCATTQSVERTPSPALPMGRGWGGGGEDTYVSLHACISVWMHVSGECSQNEEIIVFTQLIVNQHVTLIRSNTDSLLNLQIQQSTLVVCPFSGWRPCLQQQLPRFAPCHEDLSPPPSPRCCSGQWPPGPAR